MRAPVLFFVAVLGCEVEDPSYEYGESLGNTAFSLYSTDMGIHPSGDVLDDPNNPFGTSGIGEETKWDVVASGDPVTGFYAMATALVQIPTGEHQFYAAQSLHLIYDLERAAPEDLVFVRSMAIEGYQAVLDYFADDVTYDATGRYYWYVAPLAIEGIEALGGDVQGGWIVTTNSDGYAIAVRTD